MIKFPSYIWSTIISVYFNHFPPHLLPQVTVHRGKAPRVRAGAGSPVWTHPRPVAAPHGWLPPEGAGPVAAGLVGAGQLPPPLCW